MRLVVDLNIYLIRLEVESNPFFRQKVNTMNEEDVVTNLGRVQLSHIYLVSLYKIEIAFEFIVLEKFENALAKDSILLLIGACKAFFDVLICLSPLLFVFNSEGLGKELLSLFDRYHACQLAIILLPV